MVDKDSKENTNKRQIVIIRIAIFFILFHLTNLFIANIPVEILPQKYSAFSQRYLSPFFSQKWSMFVPSPVIHGQIYLKIYTENDTIEWVRPYEKEINMQHKIPFLHYDDLAIGIENINYLTTYDLESNSFPKNIEVNYKNFKDKKKIKSTNMLKKFVNGYLNKQKINNHSRIDIKIESQNFYTDSITYYLISDF